jgi:hypothetical protein
MARYFVNLVSGDDANSGVSAASPWRHAPDDDLATGRAAAVDFTSSDEILVCAQPRPKRRWKDVNDERKN